MSYSHLFQAPSYHGFIGSVERMKDGRYVAYGEISVTDENTVEITDLPIKIWTEAYKENVLEPMASKSQIW